jgi:hypothetical protein
VELAPKRPLQLAGCLEVLGLSTREFTLPLSSKLSHAAKPDHNTEHTKGEISACSMATVKLLDDFQAASGPNSELTRPIGPSCMIYRSAYVIAL